MSISGPRGARIAVGVAALALAGILAGTVVAGRLVWLDDVERLDQAIASASAVKVAEIAAADGRSARGVFVQTTSTGHVCVSDAPLGAPLMGGGGCNPAADPLAGAPLSVSLAYEGGPAIDTVTDARVIGLASAETAAVGIVMSDGSFRTVRITKAKVGSDDLHAYGYRFKKRDLERGIGPTAIVAYDAAGGELGRQPTGIG
jgi:hypothetical protein